MMEPAHPTVGNSVKPSASTSGGWSQQSAGISALSTASTSGWSIQQSAQLYGINSWGAGYFSINEKGHIAITPRGKDGPQIDLMELIEDLTDRGIRVPILVRFPDIVKARVELLANCFAQAIQEYGYRGSYQGVYPIKVNQQRQLVEEIIEFGEANNLGLECGSKPELLVALALMTNPRALLICNGFKDFEFIETALLAQKLGRNTVIVVDRMSELPVILETAKKLNVRPNLGFRAKLDSKGSGKWVESSGARSKFGLTPSEMVEGVEVLKRENMLECLQLVHFHIGSQITSIQAIKASLTEGCRFFVELSKMGTSVRYLDVGGGLGIDYDGSGSSDSSTNYSEQEYANDVVATIQSICDEAGVQHPVIITEAGRALVAHHSILVFNVLGVNEVECEYPYERPDKKNHKILHDLHEIFEKLNAKNINEFYNDLFQLKHDSLQLFSYGYLSLDQRAKAEKMVRAIMTKMARLCIGNPDAVDIHSAMSRELTDSLFCNFSVFQSVPDSWAVGQIFPLMPIHRLGEEPTKRATIVDLTCDSDGKIDRFSDGGSVKHALEVHTVHADRPYYLGVFLLGAYQEILGDLHNLFGDTDAVHVGIGEAGYTIKHVVEGDSVAEVLSYLQYSRTELVNNIRQATEQGIRDSRISKIEARLLMKHYEEGLAGYTYLEEAGVS